MNEILFSIVIPIYNYAHSLQRCVNSVLKQSYKHYQIILVNDGSTDNTDELCKALCAEHSDIISYISQENSGPSAARNAGLQQAAGQFITFLDADDEMAEEALSYLASAADGLLEKSNKPSILLGGHTAITEKGEATIHPVSKTYLDPTENFIAYLINKKLSVSNGAIYFHRGIFKILSFPETIRSSEDIPVFALALANYPCIAVNQILVIVHKHKTSLRNQSQLTINTGLGIVPLIFDSPLLPGSLHRFKKQFITLRLLSLFRSLYNSGHYEQARSFYFQAISQQPTALFKFSYLRKFIKSFL